MHLLSFLLAHFIRFICFICRSDTCRKKVMAQNLLQVRLIASLKSIVSCCLYFLPPALFQSFSFERSTTLAPICFATRLLVLSCATNDSSPNFYCCFSPWQANAFALLSFKILSPCINMLMAPIITKYKYADLPTLEQIIALWNILCDLITTAIFGWFVNICTRYGPTDFLPPFWISCRLLPRDIR